MAWKIGTDQPLAVAAVEAIRVGDVDRLRQLLAEHDGLAGARLGSDAPDGMTRTLLHVATDWPGHFPNVAASVGVLVDAGADVDAQFTGPHTETPLHWAASSDDVDALDALLDRGANIEAPGAVIAGGTPLSDAVAFGQWNTARRLVERGAHTPLREAAALGLLDRVEHIWTTADRTPDGNELDQALWYACHGGQQHVVELLLELGAHLNWATTWDHSTPLDAAERSGATELTRWLLTRGAKRANELTR